MIKFYSIIKLSIDVRRTSSKGVPSGKVHRTCFARYFLFLVLASSLVLAWDRSDRKSVKQQMIMRALEDDERLATEYKIHDIGRVWSTVSNDGVHGHGSVGLPGFPVDYPSMEWPGGSGKHYLWNGSIWVSAKYGSARRSSQSNAFAGVNEFAQFEEVPFLLPAPDPKSVEDSYAVFNDFVDSLHNTKSLGIRVAQRGLTWTPEEYDDLIIYELEFIKELGDVEYSGDLLTDLYVTLSYDCDLGLGVDTMNYWMDDLVDYDGWDGNNPEQYVTYKQDIVENGDINGDGFVSGYDELGIPYGMEFLGNAAIYQPNYDAEYTYPDGFYDEYTVLLAEEWEDAPLLRWQISAENTDYTAIAGRVAVVNGDSLRGYLVSRNMSYMYDGDRPSSAWDDTGEGGETPGFIGLRLIYTDYWKTYGPYLATDDDTLLRPFSHQWGNWETWPWQDDVASYKFVAADHSNNFGCYFMPHPFDLNAPVFDYQFVLSTGPFPEVVLGDTIRVVFASAVGKGLQGLRQNMDAALKVYFAGSEGTPYDPTGPEEDVHYKIAFPPPSPVLSYNPLDKGVLLSWDNSAEGFIDPMVGTTSDFVGYRIYRSMFHPENWEFIAAFDIVDEPVILLNYETGDTLFGGAKFNLPPFDGEPLPHEFIDTMTVFTARDEYGVEVNLLEGIVRPVNNHPYFYVVTAYDDPALIGKPELPSLESPRRNYRRDPDTGEPEPVYPRVLYDAGAQWDGKKVSIFPNPYRGGTGIETGGQSKINFTNLPPACKISIFSVSGDLIKEFDHTAGTADASWDLKSRSGLDIVSGLYIYVVEADLPTWPEVQRGTFVVLKGN